MTRQELRDMIRKKLGETTAAFWSDSQLNTWINLGCKDLANRTKCLKTNGYITTEDCSVNLISTKPTSWTLSTEFPNILSIIEVYFHEEGESWTKLTPTTRDELDRQYEGWRDAIGRTNGSYYNFGSEPSTPFCYWYDIEEDIIEIYPPCDADNATTNNLRVYYSYNHSDISLDTDSPTIPERLHLAIVDFVSATAFGTRGWGDRENDSWQKYYGRILDYITERKREKEDEDVIMIPVRNM